MRIVAWNRDHWNSLNGTIKWWILKYDKVEHFLLSMLITFWLWWVAILLGLGNEIWDGFVPWEKYGWIGGEGFSYKDLLADSAGVIVGSILKVLFVWIVL